MQLVEPINITDSDYTGGNLVENDTIDAPEWADGTDYDRGDYARIESVHAIYQCLTNHTADDGVNDPLTEDAAFADPLTDDPNPTHWQYVSATNKWKVFDGRPSQRAVPTTEGDDIEVEVTLPSRVSVVALIELVDASQAVIEVFDEDGNETYAHTIDLNDTREVVDWLTYYYTANRLLDSLVVTDLPITSAGDEVHVTISGGDDLAVGQIVMGQAETYGEVVAGQTGFEFQDFSEVQQNPYGDLITVRRAATNRYRFEVEIDSTLINAFGRRIYDFRGGRRALFVGVDTAGTRIWQYGFSRDFHVLYRSAHTARADFVVQGVV